MEEKQRKKLKKFLHGQFSISYLFLYLLFLHLFSSSSRIHSWLIENLVILNNSHLYRYQFLIMLYADKKIFCA